MIENPNNINYKIKKSMKKKGKQVELSLEQQAKKMQYLYNMKQKQKQLNIQAKVSEDNYYCQNSLTFVEHPYDIKKEDTLYIPVYLRIHFRNLTDMDIENLSSTFVATMCIDFYLGKYRNECKMEQQIAMDFANFIHSQFMKNLKVTFQNDMVVSMGQDMTTNVSDSDKLIRADLVGYAKQDKTYLYSNFVITREFKFGLHSDVFFFPLQQNMLELVTTINSIKTKYINNRGNSKKLVIRFNCMNLEIGEDNLAQINNEKLKKLKQLNLGLIHQLEKLYMVQNKHNPQKQFFTDQVLKRQFILYKNHPFFRDVRISFPYKKNATEFGEYKIIEKDVMLTYTNLKQFNKPETTYEKWKNFLFCRKSMTNLDLQEQLNQKQSERMRATATHSYQALPVRQDRSRQVSFCSTIISIPLLKVSIATILQLCIPIFFLAILTIVQFLYSQTTSLNQVRGLKIAASTLIVATYISFVYSMRSAIPPTPTWSIFQIAVCLLAFSCLFPIIQVIYQTDISNTKNPFTQFNVLFIVSFSINVILCGMIIILLIVVSIYFSNKTQRQKPMKVKMGDILQTLTKEYFYLWRNHCCREFMIAQLNKYIQKEAIKKPFPKLQDMAEKKAMERLKDKYEKSLKELRSMEEGQEKQKAKKMIKNDQMEIDDLKSREERRNINRVIVRCDW